MPEAPYGDFWKTVVDLNEGREAIKAVFTALPQISTTILGLKQVFLDNCQDFPVSFFDDAAGGTSDELNKLRGGKCDSLFTDTDLGFDPGNCNFSQALEALNEWVLACEDELTKVMEKLASSAG